METHRGRLETDARAALELSRWRPARFTGAEPFAVLEFSRFLVFRGSCRLRGLAGENEWHAERSRSIF